MKWLCGLVMAAAMFTTARADDLSKAKAAYAEQDKALNATYAALKKDLPAEAFAKVQDDQRGWVEYRDYICTGPGRMYEEDSVDRWKLIASLTQERAEWLKAWKKLGQRKGWAGHYEDSRGGSLDILEKDGHTKFTLFVVRGPSAHTGEIAGELRVNGSTAWFETKAEGEEKPTWLTFLDNVEVEGVVQVAEENTNNFHGMRAYFRGRYLWTRELTAKEKKEVLKGGEGE